MRPLLCAWLFFALGPVLVACDRNIKEYRVQPAQPLDSAKGCPAGIEGKWKFTTSEGPRFSRNQKQQLLISELTEFEEPVVVDGLSQSLTLKADKSVKVDVIAVCRESVLYMFTDEQNKSKEFEWRLTSTDQGELLVKEGQRKQTMPFYRVSP